jgi:hypothetical protein
MRRKAGAALARQKGLHEIDGYVLFRILYGQGDKFGPVERHVLERLDKFTLVERQVLERLRKDGRLGEVCQRIEPHCRNDDDCRELIGAILYAARETLEGPIVLERVRWSNDKWPKAILHARALHDILTDKKWTERRQHAQLASSLSQFLEKAAAFKLSYKRDSSPEQLGLSREYRTLEGQRSTFMSHLSQRMSAIFDKPLNEEVRILTEIVLDCQATLDQVRSARRFGVNAPTTRSGRSRRR